MCGSFQTKLLLNLTSLVMELNATSIQMASCRECHYRKDKQLDVCSSQLTVMHSKNMLVIVIIFILAFINPVLAQEPQEEVAFSIEEEVESNSYVGDTYKESRIEERYNHMDLDDLSFRFLAEPAAAFSIDESTGVIRTSGNIDRDVLCADQDACGINLDVVALANGNFLEMIKVMVEIKDVNDNYPVFNEDSISHQILESAVPGYGFVIPTAIDIDSGINKVQKYSIVSNTDKFDLTVNKKVDGSTDVRLILLKAMDREIEDYYKIRVVAYDGGNPPKSGTIDVNIVVQDANDNNPVFENSTYEVSVSETTPKDTTIVRVKAKDLDAGKYGEIKYGFSQRTGEHHGRFFAINQETGEISLVQALDHENGNIYHLVVMAFDQGPDSIPADATVVVRVLDANDNAPAITVNTLAHTGTNFTEIAENSKNGTFVAHLTVVDPDQGRNGEFNCSLSTDDFKLKQMFTNEFTIVTHSALDRELTDRYYIQIQCKDRGNPPLSSRKNIMVNVKDENDHSPIFNQSIYYVNLTENNNPSAYITKVKATDQDSGANSAIHYKLGSDAAKKFSIDADYGTIKANKSFDREENDVEKFTVIAYDNGTPSREGSATVILRILDVNDSPPSFSMSTYSFGIFENEPAGTSVGSVTAVDPDSGAYNKFEYSLLSTPQISDKFRIDNHTGLITTLAELDREETLKYFLEVMARDHTGSSETHSAISSTATVTIHVADKNDNPPIFDFPSEANNTIYISNKVPKSYVITKVQAIDKDIGKNANLTYSITSGNHLGFFHIDPQYGLITVAKDLSDKDHFQFELRIKAKDGGEPEKYTFTNLNIVVNKTIAFVIVSESHILTGHNFTIVVVLACVSGLVMVCLVIAIIMMRKKENTRRTHKYNCPGAERLKMMNANQDLQQTDSEINMMTTKQLSNGSCSTSMDCDRLASPRRHNNLLAHPPVVPTPPTVPPTHPHIQSHSTATLGHMGTITKKEVSFNLDHTGNGNHHHYGNASEQSWPSTIDRRTLEMPEASSSILSAERSLEGSQASSSIRETSQDKNAMTYNRPWALTQQELEVHQLLAMLKDQDGDSSYSGEGSNTDSGRGASEEGEQSHHQYLHHVHPSGINTLPHPRRSTSSLAAAEASLDQSINQVVPQVNELHSFTSHHSYSSGRHEPPRLQTFAPRTLPTGNAETSLSIIPDEEEMYELSPLDKPNRKAGKCNDAYISTTPNNTTTGNVSSISPIYEFRSFRQNQTDLCGRPFGSSNVGFQGYHSDCETDDTITTDDDATTTTGLKYSCADMTEQPTSHYQLELPSSANSLHDDVSTTTSGSYVVDPQELVNEIDELFFKDMVV